MGRLYYVSVHATVETIITRERGKKRPIERGLREGGRREKRTMRRREYRGTEVAG